MVVDLFDRSSPQSGTELTVLVVIAAGLLSALLALQVQAAILILRDQRYAVSAIGASICTTALAGAIIGIAHEQATPAFTVAAAATVLYVALLCRRGA